jgi:cytidylate kinase
MYRALTERVQAQGVDPEDEAQVGQIAANMSFDLERSSEEWAVTEHGKPLSHEALHSPAIDRDVSAVSAHPSVRAEMVRQQREIAGGREIVMVGRDIGTVVLPHAPVKLFVTASPEVRARRRHLQRNTDRTAGDSELSTLRDIRARDEYDQSRPVSPLRPAPGAALVDTSSRSETESLEIALSAVGQALRQTAPNG